MTWNHHLKNDNMEYFNHVLQGEDATEQNAIEHAQGLDWQGIETTEQPRLVFTSYVDTVNGIEIWYCYGTDSYLFTPEEK